LTEQKIKLTVWRNFISTIRTNTSSISNKLAPKLFFYYLQKHTCQNQFI
jgi:hypothetical protein